MSTIQADVTLETLTCWAREGCGITFAIPWRIYTDAKVNGTGFYCPKGHHLGLGKSDLQKAQEEIERLKTDRDLQRERREQEERRVVALKGVVTRTKNRIGNGVCPCCNRHFTNVERHMTTQHPDYAKEPSK